MVRHCFAALLLLSCMSSASAQFRWGNCDSVAHVQITAVRTYCCGLNAIVSHCLAVVDLANGGSLATEQEGNGYVSPNCDRKCWREKSKNCDQNGCYKEMGAYIKCSYQAHRIQPLDLVEHSQLFAMGSQKKYKVIEQQPQDRAADTIAGYSEAGALWGKGYDTSKSYPTTVAGLKHWSEDYFAEFPYYRSMSTNCQKYSVGVYNAVTHSSKAPKQFYSKIVSPFLDLMEVNKTENHLEVRKVADDGDFVARTAQNEHEQTSAHTETMLGPRTRQNMYDAAQSKIRLLTSSSGHLAVDRHHEHP